LGLTLLPLVAEGGSLGKAAARGAARSIAKALPRQKLGPIHRFRKPTPLERFTNKPKTDLRKGLDPHSFWTRPEPGPKGSAAHVRKELNIPHSVRRGERMTAPPGTRYHERPIRGAHGRKRETILHNRVPRKNLELGDRLRNRAGHP